MAVKDVYSIRITKKDEEIRDYLDQFPLSKQNSALKTLLKFGIEKLENNVEMDNTFKKINETIDKVNNVHEQRLEEIISLIAELKAKGITIKETESDEDEESIDLDKARKSMEEALSMFSL